MRSRAMLSGQWIACSLGFGLLLTIALVPLVIGVPDWFGLAVVVAFVATFFTAYGVGRHNSLHWWPAGSPIATFVTIVALMRTPEKELAENDGVAFLISPACLVVFVLVLGIGALGLVMGWFIDSAPKFFRLDSNSSNGVLLLGTIGIFVFVAGIVTLVVESLSRPLARFEFANNVLVWAIAHGGWVIILALAITDGMLAARGACSGHSRSSS